MTLPTALIDSWLMGLFPGRLLEELDTMDLGRVERAVQAKRVLAVEEKRRLFHAQSIGRDGVTADEWRAIAEHDGLVSDG